MVIDTSVIISILYREVGSKRYVDAIESADVKLISAGNYLEAAIVADRSRGLVGAHEFTRFFEYGNIEIVSFDQEQAEIARDAYRKYGKGNHPAGLNFGDCFSYALSMATAEPLLFKGNDFARTDVEPVTLN